jgi:hypothetical protein
MEARAWIFLYKWGLCRATLDSGRGGECICFRSHCFKETTGEMWRMHMIISTRWLIDEASYGDREGDA